MKLASILPVMNLSMTYDGQYAMLLAHLKNYYPIRDVAHKNCYVIMDNSLIELGGAVSIEAVDAAASRIGADEIILPDVFQKGQLTVDAAIQSIRWLHGKYGAKIPYKLMAVCQGETIGDFERCFAQLETLHDIHCIGIPKIAATLRQDNKGEGREFLEYIWEGTSKNIHLLGVYKSLRELLAFKAPAKIRSVDTCIPALLSMTGNCAWTDRPEKTIDLLNDQIRPLNYAQIMLDLRKENLI